MKYSTFSFIFSTILLSSVVSATNYYVSPNGNDANSGTLSSPWASPLKAWTTAVAGDTVFFRGGTYQITSQIWTNYYGNSGTQANPITFTNYPGESVTFNGGNLQRMITIEKDWNIIRGINFVGAYNQLEFGDDFHITGGIVENCISSGFMGGDNMGFLVTNQATGIIIRNCTIKGPGNVGVHGNTGGVIAFNAYGIKILNNEISNVPIAIYYKHGQLQTTDTGVEIAYNYMYNTGRHVMELNTYGAHIHNNIIGQNNSPISINEGNGGSNGNHNRVIHNTFLSPLQINKADGSGGLYNTLRDNVFLKPVAIHLYGSATHHTTLNYNLYNTNAVHEYVEGAYYTLASWKTHYGQDQNSLSGTPTFTGGAIPSSIAGFELSSTSLGKNAASDGTDLGAKVCAVGPNANCNILPQTIDTTSPTQVTGLTATSTTSSQINLSWNVASDNIAVIGYRIYRNNLQIATSQTNRYTDTGLNSATTYQYKISAYDAAGNIGQNSTAISITTSQNITNNTQTTNNSTLKILECSTPKPEWIWCEDFEIDRSSNYFEYNNNGGDFVRISGVGINGSTGMRTIWQQGEVWAGDFKVAFGKRPNGGFSPAVDSGTTNYRDIYWRMYVKNQPGWIGGGGDKLSRAIVFASNNWAQAAIGHVWSVNTDYLGLDPASGTDTSGNLKTTSYNDFANMRWLGIQQGSTPIFNNANVGQWHCIEAHMKLNDANQNNGINELWINDVLQSRQSNLNWVGNYSAYGINSIFFENYWNSGAQTTQQRFFDNIIISTQRIGCANTTASLIQIQGDVNSDGIVNILDINAIVLHFGKTASYPDNVNLAASTTIDLFDAMVIIRNWGATQ